MGVGEIGREMRKDLVHVLGSLAPGSPEVQDNGCAAPHQIVKLLLRLHIIH
ncbi:hypothetical protein TIFTF001_051905 [Ficus carica]|uniref:Uncharacterized protein n=1 Tax=Ficus carica TaxID=3494 RepID=A0AA88JEN6_FICCA|nr:hypothetical protein TIFTF001_051825 [Ficus carica]GMN71966.1 hypothetical protein TIFTF001_051905 [Ficus carica]